MRRAIVWQTRRPKRSGVDTLQCIAGNGGVQSAEDNAPTAAVPAGWGLAKPPMGNHREPLINLVNSKWRKALKRHAKRQVARGRRFYLAAPPLVARPGKWGSLKEALNVDLVIPGNPVGSHRHFVKSAGGIPRAIKDDGPAGRGVWRKRRPSCNGRDRAAPCAIRVERPNAKACPLPNGPN